MCVSVCVCVCVCVRNRLTCGYLKTGKSYQCMYISNQPTSVHFVHKENVVDAVSKR